MAPERDNIEEFLRGMNLKKKRKYISAAVIALIVIVLANTVFYSVGAESVGVIQRFGEYVRTTTPGLHLKLPFGIEKVTKVPVTRILTQEFGFRTEKPGVRTVRSKQSLLNESLMLTGDLNVVVAEWIVQYKIKDPKDYLFNVNRVEETIRDVSESAMRQVVGDRSVDGVITIERMEIGDDAQKKMQEILDDYGAGIQIVTVKLQDVTPPDQVKPAFNAVNEAKQEYETLINQARKEYNTVIPKARGDAEKTVKEAEGYAIDRINRAEGDAARFLSIWRKYSQAKDVTRRRLYMETMAKVLPRVERKYIVDDEESGILRILPLEETSGKGVAK
ncbi:MAG: FtsH protease activity modulator HflK [Candidatus Zixiibacteriota bacterium]|nr:MAG: FtsH protease activity modulator HflK [candidate division Zixibacteria bacterium]